MSHSEDQQCNNNGRIWWPGRVVVNSLAIALTGLSVEGVLLLGTWGVRNGLRDRDLGGEGLGCDAWDGRGVRCFGKDAVGR